MPPDKHQSGMVVVASAPTLCEAQVLQAVLTGQGIDAFIIGEAAAQWLPHMSVALNPRGIEVAVRAEDAADAREFLKPRSEALQGPHAEEPSEEPGYRQSPDYYAERAHRSTRLTLICPPFIFVTPYLFIRALAAGFTRPAGNPRRFRAHMLVAFVLGILLPWIVVGWLVYSMLPGPEIVVPPGAPLEKDIYIPIRSGQPLPPWRSVTHEMMRSGAMAGVAPRHAGRTWRQTTTAMPPVIRGVTEH